MKEKKQKKPVIVVLLFILSAMLVFGSLLAIAHNIVISDNIEKQKSKSVKITAFVDHLGYEARVKHFVASVIYTVDDKEYKANVDNVTTENKHGSKIDIYINPNNPREIVDELNNTELFDMYFLPIALLVIGLIIFTILLLSGIAKKKRQKALEASPDYVPEAEAAEEEEEEMEILTDLFKE